jgi:hypothetical protein
MKTPGLSGVAQIFNLPYRRHVVCEGARVWREQGGNFLAAFQFGRLPIKIGDTAG